MNQETRIINKEEIFNSLQLLKDQGEFSEAEYSQIDELINFIRHGKRSGALSTKDIKEISYYYGKEFLENTIQGMGLQKKFGYAGDFLVIDKIYSKGTSENPFYKSWDSYFHNHAAPRAVRNRKEYFKKMMMEEFVDCNEINLLNVASGPARDLLELFEEKPTQKRLSVTCVEMDKFAIEYAKKITAKFEAAIEFENINIFKYETNQQHDIIWSAGLFDYFDDKGFIFVLNKLKSWLKPNGKIVIGNFW